MIRYDEIVIGSSLRAFLYAYNKNLPILLTKSRRPFKFEYFEPDVDFSYIGIDEESRVFKTFGENKVVGIPKTILWETLAFSLSIDGLCPLSNLCHSIRNYDGRLVCSNEYSKIAEYEFNTCYYFGDDNTTGIVAEKEPKIKKYICYDWIAINRGGKIEYDFMDVGDDLVNHVWFYSSDRIDGNTGVKDACVVSYLNSDQLSDFDYSETMARFKMLAEMDKRGIKGRHAGGYTSAGNPKRYKIKATHMFREKIKNYTPTLIPSDNVIICEHTEEDLLEEFKYVSQDNTTFMRFYNAFSGDNTNS